MFTTLWDYLIHSVYELPNVNSYSSVDVIMFTDVYQLPVLG
jgi:hypothetical protein